MKTITVDSRRNAAAQAGRSEIERRLHADALQIAVPLQTVIRTTAVLKIAAAMCEGLNWSVRLLDVQVVPARCGMDSPPIDRNFSETRLRSLADAIQAPVSGILVYSRDWEAGLFHALTPESLVVLAVRKRIWKTVEERLAERLRAQGHQVILVECK